jgi:hypothetical protein
MDWMPSCEFPANLMTALRRFRDVVEEPTESVVVDMEEGGANRQEIQD